MDAFEQIVAELFWTAGYWVRTSVKVDLTKEEKVRAGKPSMPRPEIDLVAYQGASNHLLALECKSYLDSRGVSFAEICGSAESKTYKLFRQPALREIVLGRLLAQSIEAGLCREGATVQLGMVAGKVKGADGPAIDQLFYENGWFFRGPGWLKKQVGDLAGSAYENQAANVVAKLLLR